jgi:hypothetical protein
VVGFEIAGAEVGYPPTRHLDAFDYMRDHNARCTMHAGEAFGLPSMHEAIAFCGADWLGHGVRIVDDINVDDDGTVRLGQQASILRDKRIPLELSQPADGAPAWAVRRQQANQPSPATATRSGIVTTGASPARSDFASSRRSPALLGLLAKQPPHPERQITRSG